jgi:hypothetical protein
VPAKVRSFLRYIDRTTNSHCYRNRPDMILPILNSPAMQCIASTASGLRPPIARLSTIPPKTWICGTILLTKTVRSRLSPQHFAARRLVRSADLSPQHFAARRLVRSVSWCPQHFADTRTHYEPLKKRFNRICQIRCILFVQTQRARNNSRFHTR